MSSIFGGGGGGSSSGLTVGVTTITGGISGDILFDNAGVLGVEAGRTFLPANATYYVSTTGSDSNPGTLVSPFATPQHAYLFVVNTLDLQDFLVTIQIEDGTYNNNDGTFAAVDMSVPWLNGDGSQYVQGTITFQGNAVNNANVVITPGVAGFAGFYSAALVPGLLQINDLTIQADTPINIATYAQILTNNVAFAPISARGTAVVAANNGGQVFINGNTSVTGNWASGLSSTILALVQPAGSFTFVGTPDFNSSFLDGSDSSSFLIESTFVGAMTGQQFKVTGGCTIDLNGQTISYLPGNVRGSTRGGGILVSLVPGAFFSYTNIGNLASQPQILTPLTGATITIDPYWRTVIKPAGALAALTIDLPPTPDRGTMARVSTTQAITALTVASTDGSAVVAPPTTLAAGAAFTMIYDLASNSWYPN